MGKKQFCFFQTAETGNRTPDSGVKGSGANHYPRAPARTAENFVYIKFLLLPREILNFESKKKNNMSKKYKGVPGGEGLRMIPTCSMCSVPNTALHKQNLWTDRIIYE